MQDGILYLSRSDIESLALGAADSVAMIEHLCRERERARMHNTPKTLVRLSDDAIFMSTLAAAEDPPFMAVKSLGVNAANAQAGMTTIGSLITLFDRKTGFPLAVMDGAWITEARTAALSAVAAKHLARPGSAVIAFIGCGAQARSHLDAFIDLFPLRAVRGFGRGQANRDRLCRMAAERGLEARDCGTARDAIEGADIVVTSVPAASGLTPFIDSGWVAPGAFVSMVDLARTWRPVTLAAFDRIVIEDTAQEAGMPEPMVALSLVAGDLGDLVAGRIADRDNERERIAFAFRGLALADLALAALAYRRALETKAGNYLER